MIFFAMQVLLLVYLLIASNNAEFSISEDGQIGSLTHSDGQNQSIPNDAFGNFTGMMVQLFSLTWKMDENAFC